MSFMTNGLDVDRHEELHDGGSSIIMTAHIMCTLILHCL